MYMAHHSGIGTINNSLFIMYKNINSCYAFTISRTRFFQSLCVSVVCAKGVEKYKTSDKVTITFSESYIHGNQLSAYDTVALAASLVGLLGQRANAKRSLRASHTST
jgi:hypothetical protein